MFRTIKLISWNVNGIQNPVKRYKILSYLQSLSCNIAMIQETHLTKQESLKLRQRWVGQVFSAPGSGAARGVSILISKRISFVPSIIKADDDGRYLVLSGTLQNEKCTLVNIYAPNSGQNRFLSPLSILLAQFADTPLLIGGDFNLVSDASIDRSSSPLPSDRASSAAFSEMRSSLALTDVWRLVNPQERMYTPTHTILTRELTISSFPQVIQ